MDNMSESFTESSVTDLDRQLRQKLVLLESAVARIANTKLQLKENSDLVKKEIRQCFGHQLTCLRSREQQLLSTLDTVITLKDELLTEQQDSLHQSLGACQQGLQCLKSTMYGVRKRGSQMTDGGGPLEAVEENLIEILNRLSGITLHPCENPHVAFEADPMSVRRTLESFGRISVSRALKGVESMPADLEDYEDAEPNLLHKPFSLASSGMMSSLNRPSLTADPRTTLFREALTGTLPQHRRGGSLRVAGGTAEVRAPVGSTGGNGIGNWLRHIKNSVEVEPAVFEDYAFSRDRVGKASDALSSSMTELALSESTCSLFVQFFNEIASSPMDKWLLPMNGETVDDTKISTQTDMDAGTDENASYCFCSQLNSEDGELMSSADNEAQLHLPANQQRKSVSAEAHDEHESLGPPANFLAKYERFLLSSNDDQWLLAEQPQPKQPQQPEQTSIDNARETLIKAGYLKNHPQIGGSTGGDDDKLQKKTSITTGDDPMVITSVDPAKMDTTEMTVVEKDEDDVVGLAPPGVLPVVAESWNTARWLLAPEGGTAPAQAGKEPPPTNAWPRDMAVYESVLGWEAILERIHAGGDEQWLLK